MSIEDNKIEERNITEVNLENVMETKFLDYAMSVVVDRAIPFVEDGLKPVHRRILWAMNLLDNKHNKPYKKSARIVGDVIGKYHPHGDTAVYDAMVRMAQEFSMRVPLIDGQGNFGSIDGDSPAAMRYTESRMSVFGEKMFLDIEKDSVDKEKNYDGTEEMPKTLPLRFPNLLINGSQGIAVAMATNMPCHNPIEVMNALLYILENEQVGEEDIDKLLELIPAPDFPTGGVVHDLKEMRGAWLNGRASMRLRAKWEPSEDNYGNPKIVITEIPYGVKKEELVVRLTEMATPDSKRGGMVLVEGVKSIQDYSSKDGIQIEIQLKRDYDPETVFNLFAKHSRLEVPVSYNNVVLVNGEPKTLGILDLLKNFILHREEVILRRTQYLLNKSEKRQHILKALIKALSDLDKVIELIKSSRTNADAKENLRSYLNIDEIQAESILRMQLRSLTNTEIDDLNDEFNMINENIKDYNEIISSKDRLKSIIVEETQEQIELFSSQRNEKGLNVYSERLTDFVYHKLDTDLAALTKEEDSVVLFSNEGYIRRIPESEIQSHNRGTMGKKYMKIGKDDFILRSIRCHSHDALMFVSNLGYVYSLYAYEISDVERGRHINNTLELKEGEVIKVVLPVSYESEKDLIMITKNGLVKKTRLKEYENSFRKSGLRGINIKDSDEIKFAVVSEQEDDLVMATSANKIIRFSLSDEFLRPLGRISAGVRGVKLDKNQSVKDVSVMVNSEESYIACITDNGIVKITASEQYRNQRRGGKGLSAMKCNDRTGEIIKVMTFDNLEGSIMVSTKKGMVNKVSVDSLRVTNRVTSGIKLVNLSSDDTIVSASYSDVVYVVEEVEEIEGVIESASN